MEETQARGREMVSVCLGWPRVKPPGGEAAPLKTTPSAKNCALGSRPHHEN